MAEALEVRHLAQQHGVAEVEIGRGGVEPGLDRERLGRGARALELAPQVRFGDEVDRAALQQRELLVDG